jgi:hypothetical protein
MQIKTQSGRMFLIKTIWASIQLQTSTGGFLMHHVRNIALASTALGVIAIAAAVGCGKKTADTNTDLVPIEGSINYTGSSLNLAGVPASTFKVDVTGCESGYSVTNQTTSPIYLYKHDLGCVATLKEFVFGGTTYTGTLTGAAGTSADFSDGGSKSLRVSIASQLSSPIVTADKIAFNFFEIKAGANSLPPGSSYSEGHNIDVSGVEAPNFEIKDVDLTSQATGGIPTYAIRFECQSNVTGSNECPAASGSLQPISAMDIKVVEDIYSGAPTSAQAEALFATAGSTATPIAVGAGTPPIAKGGMSTSAVGPGPMYQKRNLIVFVRYTVSGASAFRYFNMDIGEPGL